MNEKLIKELEESVNLLGLAIEVQDKDAIKDLILDIKSIVDRFV